MGSLESDTTERLHLHFSLLCIGEVSGNPLQCSCLENPRDGGAWWAAIYGVAQSRTRLKWLSRSSSMLLWRRQWQPTPVFLPGKSHRQRGLAGYGPWGRKELDTTEQQHAFVRCPFFLTFFPNSSIPNLLWIFIEWINAYSNVFMLEYSVCRRGFYS